ncbi:MAG: hypothetical protein HJJLKODD_00013 [Phycisphaerae bacterium]|nr:hypothetical protein [Phycisphaerae bacterium]
MIRAKYAIFSMGVLISTIVPPVKADSWNFLTQTVFKSENGKFQLIIHPRDDWPDHPASCQANLYEINDEGKKLLWTRNLINEYAPVGIYISNSGEYVVTLDEWGNAGNLPVVIYGQTGQLIEVHNLQSLGLQDEIGNHIFQTVSNTWWRGDSLEFFGPEDMTFVIRLGWGKILALELSTGQLLDCDNQSQLGYEEFQEYIDLKVKQKTLQLLESKDARENQLGAMIAAQIKPQEAIPLLQKLLSSEAYYSIYRIDETRTDNSTLEISLLQNVYYVRIAAKEVLESMGVEVKGVILEYHSISSLP